MKILSATKNEDGVYTLDGSVVDGIESLRQRIIGALNMRKGSWFLDRSAGMDWGLIFQHHRNKSIAASIITHEIKKEAGNELRRVKSVDWDLNPDTRTLHYRIELETIYGDLTVEGGLSNVN